MRRPIIWVIVMALTVTGWGCTTLDPYTGEKKVSTAAKGAAIGTFAGAALGYLTARDDSRRKRRNAILIGAGVGGLSGGAVGHYMDRQEMELRQQLEGTGVSVTRQGDNLILNMPSNITFDVNRAEIKSQFMGTLNSVATVLKEYDKTAVEIVGHTDNSGADDYNQRLSMNRAVSVAEYLTAQGIPSIRMETVGYGETRPVSSNDSEAGRQANRRVELTLIPLTPQASG